MDITDNQDLGKIPVPAAAAIPTTPTHQKQVDPLLPKLSAAIIKSTVDKMSSYSTRLYRDKLGRTSALWLRDEYVRITYGKKGVTVELFENSFVQPNIIARIEGSTKKNEIVIIGGHIDSISNVAAAPGADDDASGSSCVLDVFRVLTESDFVPHRTIEFHGYAGEEGGLLGSQNIAKAYAAAGKEVVAMMQLDMTGYVAPRTTASIGIVTDYTNAALNTFLRALVSVYLPGVQWKNTLCGYACSDHASWYRAGYTACFPFEGLFGDSNPAIHTANDRSTSLDFNHARNFAALALSFLVELSLD